MPLPSAWNPLCAPVLFNCQLTIHLCLFWTEQGLSLLNFYRLIHHGSNHKPCYWWSRIVRCGIVALNGPSQAIASHFRIVLYFLAFRFDFVLQACGTEIYDTLADSAWNRFSFVSNTPNRPVILEQEITNPSLKKLGIYHLFIVHLSAFSCKSSIVGFSVCACVRRKLLAVSGSTYHVSGKSFSPRGKGKWMKKINQRIGKSFIHW